MDRDIYKISLIDLMPDSIKQDSKIKAAAKAIESQLQTVAAEIDKCLLLSRLNELPENLLDLLAWQWHVDFYEPIGLSIMRKRELIRHSIAWHRYKGTPTAVEEVIKAAYGNCELKEWHEYGGKPYFFKVAVTLEEESTDKNRWKNVIAAIHSAKNTRSWMEEILFYYPPIRHLIEIRQSFEAVQFVETRHCIYNLGGARTTRWDGEFRLDATIRLDGIYPDALYREQLKQKAIIEGLSHTWHRIPLEQLARGEHLSETRQGVQIRQSADSANATGLRLAVNTKQKSKALEKINSYHHSSHRLGNVLDGGFCWDGSHRLDGAHYFDGHVNQCCTVAAIKKGKEGAAEPI